jgi:hypothetical protein
MEVTLKGMPPTLISLCFWDNDVMRTVRKAVLREEAE